MSNYTIEQFVEHSNQYEPIPEGDFYTEQAALFAMHDLQNNCGFTDLRIVDSECHVVADSE